MSPDPGAWLTAARVDRLPVVLRSIRAQPPPGLAIERGVRVVWKTCGGPLDDVAQLLDMLVTADLVAIRNDRIRITRAGQQVATQDHQQGGTLLARALISAGYFVDQARALIEIGETDPGSGALVCPRTAAIGAAPQLVGILRRFSGVNLTQQLIIPGSVAAELSDLWTVPPRHERSDPRTAIGERGELYSYRYEQLRAADPDKVRWVARDDESLGYDIEDLNPEPRRRIEAKSSTASALRFFLSRNEWNVAHRDPDSYEVQFWGNVDLNRRPRDDYARLRKAGFPWVYQNLPALLDNGFLVAIASQYIVTGDVEEP